MRHFTAIAALAIPAFACSLSTANAHPHNADLILENGKIITVDARDTVARAVAVVGNRIVAVGDVAEWKGPNTQVIDLKGRTVLPGFIDSHSHVEGMAYVETHYINIQVPPLKDANAIIEKLKEAAAKLPPGSWLIGQGTYNQVMPTREQLDAAFPDNPVRLIWSAHDSMINHKAAVVMGMTKDFPDLPPGNAGRYERLPNGEVVIIRDAPAPWPKLAEFTYPELKEAVRYILEDFYLKRGVTTVSDLSNGETYRAYQDLRKEGRLPTRVRLNYVIGTEAAFDRTARIPLSNLQRTGVVTGLGDDMVRIGAVKILFDGVWGTTAAVYKPFWKGSGTTWMPDNHGGTLWSKEDLEKTILEAHRTGWQIFVHANGDRAQDMVLDAYEAAQRAHPRQDARHRIEHFSHFLVQDPERTQERLMRMRRAGIIPSPQIAFIWRLTDTNIQEPDVKFFPLKTLISLGFQPPGGVDTIGTQNFATNPLFSIARAVRRDTKYGKIVQPEEAISVMDAIRMFTIWSAYANFMEDKLGSIEVGKLADFVVLGADPLTTRKEKLADIPIEMTILDGKVVYRRN